MKKTMITLAATFAAAVSMAAVTSQVVGYNTTSLSANKLYMIAGGFDQPGGVHAATLSDIKTDTPFQFGDNIQVGLANADGVVEFTNYLYLDFMDPAGWYLDDMATYAGDVEIPLGSSMWIILQADANVTIGGEVYNSATAVVPFLANKLTMASSAYPVPFNPNQNCSWTGCQFGDNIQVGLANADGVVEFTNYLYLDFMDPAGWYLDDMATYAEAIAGVGQGFWIITQGDVTLTQTSPIQ